MTYLYALWLPILLSAVLVFIASSVIHMLSPWHKSDYPPVPDEARVMDALRPFNIPPGDLFMPRPAGRSDLRSAEFAEKMRKGPNVIMTVLPNGPRGMGGIFVLWFLYCVVVGVLAAYIAGVALPPGAATYNVFRFICTNAFIGYSLALWQFSIWYHRRWSTTIKATVDGAIYAALTALVFVWLWPK